MLAYVIDAARDVAERPLVVISPASEAARQVFGETVDWVVQDPPQGTGDALRWPSRRWPASPTRSSC